MRPRRKSRLGLGAMVLLGLALGATMGAGMAGARGMAAAARPTAAIAPAAAVAPASTPQTAPPATVAPGSPTVPVPGGPGTSAGNSAAVPNQPLSGRAKAGAVLGGLLLIGLLWAFSQGYGLLGGRPRARARPGRPGPTDA